MKMPFKKKKVLEMSRWDIKKRKKPKPVHPVLKFMDENRAIFEERNEAYGDNFDKFGNFAAPLFAGNSPRLETPADWNRFAILMHIMDKFSRYVNNFNNGGHEDSLNDISNYALILKHLDKKQGE